MKNTLKVKRLVKEAIVPSYAKPGDAGLDLTAASVKREHRFIEYGTGLSVELPKGHVGLLFPRSSVTNKDMMLKNSVGVLDEGYRGEIKLRFQSLQNSYGESVYQVGERIGQLVIVPVASVDIQEVTDLEESDRGIGGFGSTGS